MPAAAAAGGCAAAARAGKARITALDFMIVFGGETSAVVCLSCCELRNEPRGQAVVVDNKSCCEIYN